MLHVQINNCMMVVDKGKGMPSISKRDVCGIPFLFL
jgi:hypothetical protein